MDSPLRTRLSTAMAISIIAFTAAACGTDSGTQTGFPAGNAAAHEDHLDAGIPAKLTSGNYVAFPTVKAIVADSEYAVVGTVDGYQDGQTLVTPSFDGTSLRDHFVVIRVKVTDALKTPKGEEMSMLFLSHIRGVEAIDADGTTRKGSGDGYTVSTPDEFAELMPVGTRVLVIANPSTPTGAKGETVVPAPDLPDGQTTLDIQHPQRFIVEDTDHSSLPGWQDYKSFNELVAAVREATSE